MFILLFKGSYKLHRLSDNQCWYGFSDTRYTKRRVLLRSMCPRPTGFFRNVM